jgi:cytochrome o ubiquinol oxidase subunit 1
MVYYPNPAWHPLLLVAALGTAVIALGILCQGIQLVVSIRARRPLVDATGDPWDGRTLEWLTASPPAAYNFPEIPVVEDIDAFMDMKEKGVAYRRPEHYHDIEMPKNAPHGMIIGGLAFMTGFGVIWHIWWLAIAAALGILGTVVARAWDDDILYLIPAAEVARLENERYGQLAAAAERRAAGAQAFPEPVPEG